MPCLRIVCVVIVGGMLAACGADDPPPAAESPRPVAAPSADIVGLTFSLQPLANPNTLAAATRDAVEQHLIAAGYRLVDAPDADVLLTLGVRTAREPSVIQLSINGQVPLHVTAVLSARAGSRMIDQFRAEFSSRGEVKGEDIEPLAQALGRSARIARFARERKQAAEAQRVQVATEDAEHARVAEETDWNRARAPGCALPIALDACDAVRLYLAKYPEGVHADDARATLAAGESKLQALQKDEVTWAQAGAAECRERAEPHACDGVEIYLVKYPAGLHADTARDLIQQK